SLAGLEGAEARLRLRPGLAACVESRVRLAVDRAKARERVGRRPAVERQVPARQRGVAKELGAEGALGAAEEPGPGAARAVGRLDRRLAAGDDAEFPDDDDHAASLTAAPAARPGTGRPPTRPRCTRRRRRPPRGRARARRPAPPSRG